MTARSPISIYVAAPELVSEGIDAVLRSNPRFLLAGCARTAEAAIAGIAGLGVTICVVDAGLPGAPAVCAAARSDGARAVLFAESPVESSGSASVLTKRIDRAAFVDALRTLARRGRLARAAGLPPGAPRLSPTQTRVLAMVVQGATIDDISRALGVSPHTAKSYVGEVYRRLGAVGRAHAAALAIRAGLV